VGLSIELPHEQFANPYISPELSFNFKYFFMRKLWFAQIAKALIVFSRRFRDDGRTLGNADTAANRETCPAERYPDLRRKYWDEVLNWKGHGAMGHD